MWHKISRIKQEEKICNIVECAYTFDAYSENIKIEQRELSARNFKNKTSFNIYC